MRFPGVSLALAGLLGLAACTADELTRTAYNAAKSSCARAQAHCTVNDDGGAPVAPRAPATTP